MSKTRGGFSIIEVIISTLIISILATVAISSTKNSTHKLSKAKDSSDTISLATFYLANSDSDNIYIKDMVRGFGLSSGEFREIADTKIDIDTKRLDSLRLSDKSISISVDTISTDSSNISFVRLR
jgi:prepilin-type N-terminal cleavage/methylation domain-containing protein